jgi:predicted aldo/keto reductase-like oxidoreductase
MPCPQNINIPAALRFHTLYETYGLNEWAKKLYSGLEVKTDRCSGCGDCKPKCPYNLSIQKKLQKSHQDMQKLP